MSAMGKQKKQNRFRQPALMAGVFLLAVLWFFAAVDGVSRDSAEEGREQLETALRRSAVACYAAEGIYPPTLEYLVDHYGVQIEDKYIVFYDVFASNIMPDITVLEKGAQ